MKVFFIVWESSRTTLKSFSQVNKTDREKSKLLSESESFINKPLITKGENKDPNAPKKLSKFKTSKEPTAKVKPLCIKVIPKIQKIGSRPLVLTERKREGNKYFDTPDSKKSEATSICDVSEMICDYQLDQDKINPDFEGLETPVKNNPISYKQNYSYK